MGRLADDAAATAPCTTRRAGATLVLALVLVSAGVVVLGGLRVLLHAAAARDRQRAHALLLLVRRQAHRHVLAVLVGAPEIGRQRQQQRRRARQVLSVRGEVLGTHLVRAVERLADHVLLGAVALREVAAHAAADVGSVAPVVRLRAVGLDDVEVDVGVVRVPRQRDAHVAVEVLQQRLGQVDDRERGLEPAGAIVDGVAQAREQRVLLHQRRHLDLVEPRVDRHRHHLVEAPKSRADVGRDGVASVRVHLLASHHSRLEGDLGAPRAAQRQVAMRLRLVAAHLAHDREDVYRDVEAVVGVQHVGADAVQLRLLEAQVQQTRDDALAGHGVGLGAAREEVRGDVEVEGGRGAALGLVAPREVDGVHGRRARRGVGARVGALHGLDVGL
mmetsp:Transcript_17830/g.62914  ORF Transcript_17830/g.62914 Transcript_17830/m.62914 type:complete len:388 (+) Transcript_17830:95-1258(+)